MDLEAEAEKTGSRNQRRILRLENRRKISKIIKQTVAYCSLCYLVYSVNYSIFHRATGKDSAEMHTI
jgi:hypothetical protein